MRALIVASLLLLPVPVAAQEPVVFTLGSGDVAGSYYASAFAICDVVNRTEAERLRCSPDPTAGSIYNLDALRRGQIDFAIVQSDLHRSAFDGTGAFTAIGPMTDLRSVLALYSETLSVLVAPEAGIATLGDLRGKRVDLGVPSSGRRATVDRVLASLGLVAVDFATISELPAGVALDALCNGTIDATLLVVGHPNAAIGQALDRCKAQLLPLTEAEIAAVLAGSPDIKPAIIPMTSYPGLTRDLPSLAVTATIVTRAATDSDIVASLVRNVVSHLDRLARIAPVLGGLDPAAMRSTALTAPLHPGAEAAFAAATAP